MFNTEDILTRLQNGESAEAIAKEFTNAINSASTQYEAEVKAKLEAEKSQKTKIDAARKVITAINEYTSICHPDSALTKELELDKEITDEECLGLINSIDYMLELYDICAASFAPIKLAIETHKEPVTEEAKKAPIKKITTPDSIFSEFFGKMNI